MKTGAIDMILEELGLDAKAEWEYEKLKLKQMTDLQIVALAGAMKVYDREGGPDDHQG